MNDLVDLKWEDSPSSSQNTQSTNIPNYSTLHPTPPNISRQSTPNSTAHSGRSTPLSAFNTLNRSTQSDGPPTAKPAGPMDSFSSLLPSKKSPAQLSMQERQKQLIEERARQAAEQQKRHNEQFKVDDSQFWEGFGKSSGRNTPALNGQQANPTEDEDDILAAFQASAPVDASSHFPPPASYENAKAPASKPSNNQPTPPLTIDDDDDDDPFGLGQMSGPRNVTSSSSHTPAPQIVATDDDDILGALGKPVTESELVRNQSPVPASQPVSAQRTPQDGAQDRAIAEIMEMGFSADQSRDALDHTSSGLDVQAAVSWLLNQAHKDAKSKASQNETRDRNAALHSSQDILSEDREAYIRQKSQTRRNGVRSPANEGDASDRPSDITSSLFKSANSLLRSGQKKMQQALADFQQEGDSSQPRWMREPRTSSPAASTTQNRAERASTADSSTDEAAMLDVHQPASHQRQPTRAKPEPRYKEAEYSSQQHRQTPMTSGPSRDLPSRPGSRPTDRVSRQATEEASAQAYVSPARRRKAPTPTPEAAAKPVPQPPSKPPREPEPELDIFNPTTTSQTRPVSSAARTTSNPPSKQASPAPPRPKPSTRQTPSVSPSTLSQSNAHRIEGTAAFKRGDYGSAHASYTSAIAPLPQNHPIIIILHSNRALTSLKNGEPKAAIADADVALKLIGPSQGEGEVISLGAGEADKPMKEFYGKALMRKAEALEHLEKWMEAAQAWREAVEAGVGAAVSIQGRNRCERAAGITPASSTSLSGRPSPAPAGSSAAKKPAVAKPKPRSAAADLAAPSGKTSEAVNRLRAANAAASAASDEAFALSDSVEARLTAWKTGKEGNLRALLASLDTVLWEGASWTKVSMGDLVMPNRCKVVYMKAIAKCHPDKIPPDAPVEQRMISASVFATLNEAWDRFKTDNGL